MKAATRLEDRTKHDEPRWRSAVARLAFACTAGLTLLWSIASFWVPLGWDQGFFASVGDVILRGGMPYRDAWEIKGPLIYYGFALSQWIFGRHLWSIRVLDLPLILTGTVAVAMITARITSPLRGRWAAVAFMLWIASLTQFQPVQPDTWAAVLITLAVWPLVERRPTLAELMFSGAMIGCAVLVKPLYLAFLALPMVQIFEEEWSKSGKFRLNAQSCTRLAAMAGMALVPPLIAVAWFAHRGGLRALVDVHLLYNVRVYSRTGSSRRWNAIRGVAEFFFSTVVVFILPMIATGAYFLWRNFRAAAGLILTWLVIACACVAAQGKFYKYHWVLVFPPVLFLASLGFDSLRSVVHWDPHSNSHQKSRWLLSNVALLLATIAVVRVAIIPASETFLWLKLVAGRIDSEKYYASHVAGRFVAGDDMNAAAYIRERTMATDTLAVFGNNSDITFLSGRKNPTRFVYALPLTEGGGGLVQTEYRNEYMTGLRQNRPTYFVVGNQWGSASKEKALHDFPALQDLLENEYHLEKRIGYLDLYRIRSDGRRRT